MKRYDRRTFLKLSGASVVMLALAGCDDSCSSGSTGSGSATETPPSPPIPVIRDGQKILTIFNAELARRRVENIKFEYSKGLEHAIQADVQMFVDNGSPEFPSDEGLNGLAEEAAKFALGEIEEAQLMHKILAVADFAGGLYVNPRRPLGVVSKGVPTMPYSEDIEVMKNTLLALGPADTADNIGPAEVKLVGIKVFTAKDGKLYWVAMGAESKKTT